MIFTCLFVVKFVFEIVFICKYNNDNLFIRRLLINELLLLLVSYCYCYHPRTCYLFEIYIPRYT